MESKKGGKRYSTERQQRLKNANKLSATQSTASVEVPAPQTVKKEVCIINQQHKRVKGNFRTSPVGSGAEMNQISYRDPTSVCAFILILFLFLFLYVQYGPMPWTIICCLTKLYTSVIGVNPWK